ncbi:MAG: phosphopentomutase, partial [Bacteroidota bacterium]
MTNTKKIIVVVLDGVGIGEAPDAAAYGDTGTNTLGNTARRTGGLHLPEMAKLGLGNIGPIDGVPGHAAPAGCYGKMREVSKGKDSTTGHWEMSGLILEKDFPYYPKGFPPDVV